MPKTIEFFYDTVSPYSYFASERIEALAERSGAEIRWRPFLLGGLHKITGNTPPGLQDFKMPYLGKDLKRLSKFHEIPYQFPQQFPAKTILAQRALVALSDEQRPEATHALYRAYWVEGADVSDPEVVAKATGAEAVEAASTQPVKDALIAATDEAAKRGAYGAPAFFVGEEQFFGQDRMDLLEAHLQGRL
ncbi:MAG: 2-hydroxychromene-2-carboxylate isomerase [SAR324 cluster bacterium]|nr:2-hydroxychromene-2-carboxylate isomerase [SAR324 cluster bacterium]